MSRCSFPGGGGEGGGEGGARPTHPSGWGRTRDTGLREGPFTAGACLARGRPWALCGSLPAHPLYPLVGLPGPSCQPSRSSFSQDAQPPQRALLLVRALQLMPPALLQTSRSGGAGPALRAKTQGSLAPWVRDPPSEAVTFSPSVATPLTVAVAAEDPARWVVIGPCDLSVQIQFLNSFSQQPAGTKFCSCLTYVTLRLREGQAPHCPHRTSLSLLRWQHISLLPPSLCPTRPGLSSSLAQPLSPACALGVAEGCPPASAQGVSLQCRRVHISQSTLDCLKGEFDVEPGDGGSRCDYLDEKGIETYLVIASKPEVKKTAAQNGLNGSVSPLPTLDEGDRKEGVTEGEKDLKMADYER